MGLLLVACGSSRAAESDPPAFDSARAWEHLRRIVAFGERPSGSPKIEELRLYLEDELRTIGLQPRRETFDAPTPIGELTFANVIADLPGKGSGLEEPPIIVLATHFDTKRLPFEFVGANDGGSGTAVLLELARMLTEAERPRAVTYRFLFLDGEEAIRSYWDGVDNCYGSRHHVAQLERAGELASVRACVLLDMVGDADLRLTRELYSDRELTQIFFRAARRIGLDDHVGAQARELRDDHQRFLEVGIPAVDLIDFEYGPDNDYWHTDEDLLDKCSQKSLEAIGQIVLAGLPGVEAFVLGI